MSQGTFNIPNSEEDITKPHTAMIIVYSSLHQKDSQNRVNGSPISYKHTEFYINAEDKSICERKVGELLQTIGNICSNEQA
jgi:hypothetical protein